MRRSALSRVLQHDVEIGFGFASDRALKPAETRRAGHCFECRIALLFGKAKPALA